MMLLENKTVLVTGGTGSLGKELVRRLLSGAVGRPRKVIVLSRDEAKQHDMRLSYLHKRVTTDEVIYENFKHVLEFRIGDVRDYANVCRSVRDADVVVNAAALKQVPTCEYFPEQAVLTNCFGAMNICRAIHENGYPVEVVVGVSTDKACKPVNVMGMSKAIQERIFIASNIATPGTRFVAVRYGNVLASRGSVIPLFHEQIRLGGPLTVTHPEMTRFLISLEQAVDLIFAALQHARPGETYVPICPSARVVDIANALTRGSQFDVKIVGVRPGEKLHEILISEEEIHHVGRRGDYYVIRSVLPELATDGVDDAGLTQEFSSADFLLSVDQTAALLDKFGLTVGREKRPEEEEFLR
jgi:FlaA1/EpsC-like NDP-sugar epimerase